MNLQEELKTIIKECTPSNNLIAIVGVDKSGKTTFINNEFGDNALVIHASPFARKLHVSNNKYWMIIREMVFAFDRRKQYKILRKVDGCVLDRCFIDAAVYGYYLSTRLNSPLIGKISRWFIRKSPDIDTIILLCPFKSKMVEIDDEYSNIDAFTQYYRNVLFEYGYELIGVSTYDLGEIEVYAL